MSESSSVKAIIPKGKKAVVIYVQIQDEYGDYIPCMDDRTFCTERIYESDLIFVQFKEKPTPPTNEV